MDPFLERVLSLGYQLHPDALALLRSIPSEQAATLLARLPEVCSDLVVEPHHLREALGSSESPRENGSIHVLKEGVAAAARRDFTPLFRHRLAQLGGLLRSRGEPVAMADLPRREGQEVTALGLVSDIRSTRRGPLVTLEDATGRVKVFLRSGREERLLADEVVAVTGAYRGGFLLANSVRWPDVPYDHAPRRGKGVALFLSDTHFGSREFLGSVWERFVEWLNAGEGLAPQVRYLFVAGDVVDGVGVYPGQEKELEIQDVLKQYEFAAAQMDRFPKQIQVVLSPGNHDAVPLPEPQPRFSSEVTSLFPGRVAFAGNPALVEAGGVRVLMYHGVSILDYMKGLGLSLDAPEQVMTEMVKRRHLAPVYGGEVPFIPREEDLHVMEEVPDILHTGHVHTVGVGRYRGVTLVNSGAWQGQTEFQKRHNLVPVPGVATAVDLETMKRRLLPFEEASRELLKKRMAAKANS
ncbi:MAG: DNA-directed DNA polymerase II small subunit [Halobacteria archaeon]